MKEGYIQFKCSGETAHRLKEVALARHISCRALVLESLFNACDEMKETIEKNEKAHLESKGKWPQATKKP